ncbi:MAG: SurA N-terminal domain-containing protein [Marinovum sp.]|nr:SurA N-terminal domain-containing protein [Marinovum sp.]
MARKSSGIGKTFVWILMGLLFVGLAGFGATNLSGTVRTIGSVGDKSISVDDYYRAVQGELRALTAQAGRAVTFRDAQQAGIVDGVISQLATIAALDHETAQLGVSISDERLGREIVALPSFQGINGEFDREAYAQSLRSNGFTEAEFEEDLREETARTLLQAAVVAANPMPSSYGDTLLNYVAETRDFSFARVDATRLETPIGDPTQTELETFHAENQARYTVPETRMITYAWLTPEMMLDTVEIDQADLENEYQANIEQYVQPERRLVERLVMPDAATAEAARSAIDTGDQTFEALVAERGLELADVDLGDVSLKSLGDAGPAVFNATQGQVVGPFDTNLGPALFRMNAVLPALETSLEDAVPLLREALAQDRARRAIDAQAQELDDLLAGGATLEELTSETDMQLGTIRWTATSGEEIAAYDRFRQAALTVTNEDFPQIEQLGDGGVFALRLDDVQESRLQTLAEVGEDIIEDWRADARAKSVLSTADTLAEQLSQGSAAEELGLVFETRSGQGRGGLLVDLPRTTMERVFTLNPEEIETVAAEDGSAIILRLDAVTPPNVSDDETAALADVLAAQGEAGLAADLFEALARDIQSRAGLQLDQQAINAVNVNFP